MIPKNIKIIREYFRQGKYDEPMDYSDLLFYLSSISPDKSRDHVINLDSQFGKTGIEEMSIQERFIFFKLLVKINNSFLKKSPALTIAQKNYPETIFNRSDGSFAEIYQSVIVELIKKNKFDNIKKGLLLNSPKIFFVAPEKPGSTDDIYKHYIGNRFITFQHFSLTVAASFLEVFGFRTDIFILSFPEEIERLYTALDKDVACISLRLNNPLAESDFNTIFLLDSLIKDKFKHTPPLLVAGGHSASVHAETLFQNTPLLGVFTTFSENILLDIISNAAFIINREYSQIAEFPGFLFRDRKKMKYEKPGFCNTTEQNRLTLALASWDFSKLDLTKYKKKLPSKNIHLENRYLYQPMIFFFTSSPDSCDRICEFCPYMMYGSQKNRISPQLTIRIIEKAIAVYPQIFLFANQDGDFLVDPKWTMEFVALFKEKGMHLKGIKFYINTTVFSCKNRRYRKLLKKRLNIEIISYGQEFASHRLWRETGKIKSGENFRNIKDVVIATIHNHFKVVRTSWILYYPTILQHELVQSIECIISYLDKNIHVALSAYALPRPPGRLALSGKAKVFSDTYLLPNGKQVQLERFFLPNDPLIRNVAKKSIENVDKEIELILDMYHWDRLKKIGWGRSLGEIPEQIEVYALLHLTIHNLLKRPLECTVPVKKLKKVNTRIEKSLSRFMGRAIKAIHTEYKKIPLPDRSL